jgi:hypothetical protein
MEESQGNERKLARAYWRAVPLAGLSIAERRSQPEAGSPVLFRIADIRSFAFPDGV